MATKIDISSLDRKTQEKIKKYGKRCKELSSGFGVKKTVFIKSKVGVIWNDAEPTEVQVTEGNEFWTQLEQESKNFLKEVKNEIKEMTKFSNEIAKKLKVNKDVFWEDYFFAG